MQSLKKLDVLIYKLDVPVLMVLLDKTGWSGFPNQTVQF
jgi:hypothetical protein